MPAQGWNYEDYPQHQTLLPKRERGVLFRLMMGAVDHIGTCKDTRPIHREFFSGLTPADKPHFAGRYRGENYPYLKHYEVSVGSDPRVGVPAEYVFSSLAGFSEDIDLAHSIMLRAKELPEAHLAKEDRMMYLVTFLCKLLVEFLRIHPYADGNGHIARYLVFAFLGANGVWPKSWPLNKRPPDPPYSKLISDYRDGQKAGLERFLFRAIAGDD